MLQAYDFLMMGVLVAAVLWGAWKGFAWQIASLASLSLSYIVAVNFRSALSAAINATPPWNIFLAMLILFLGTSLVVWVGFNLVRDAIEKMKLKEFDRQVGALVGLAKGGLLCILITLFAMTLLSPAQRQTIVQSRSVYYIALVLDQAGPILPQEIQPVLAEYRNQLGNPANPYPSGYPQPGFGGNFPPVQLPQFGDGQFPQLPNFSGQPLPGGNYPPPQSPQQPFNYGAPAQQPQPQMADRFRQPY